MCNEYHREAPRAALDAAFRRLGAPLQWRDAEASRPAGEPFKPTGRATLLRPVDPMSPAAGLEGLDLRWWMVPYFHKGPVADWKTVTTTVALESVDTSPTFREAYKARRALIPLTSFVLYEEPPGWRKGSPKRRWEVSWDPAGEGDEVRYFAGLWDHAEASDGALDSFAFVTGPAGADIASVHETQPVVLTLAQGMDWLRLDGPGKGGLVTETPSGSYRLAERPRDSVMSREMRRALP